MKRNSLTTAVVAGIAGTVGIANLASAVNLNPDGLGQVLIYPYYTVNSNGSGENLQTLFSVVNTTNQGKAVKVRFVEGYNSREVRDFHVYLSPYDVWTANLFKLPGQEQANLLTDDNSCTVPRIKGAPASSVIGILPDGRSYVKFTNSRYSGTFADGGPTTLDRTREGHFEMIEMGVVDNVPGTLIQPGGGVIPAQNSIAAITHIAGVPANCSQVVGAWVGQPAGYWIKDAGVDILPPTGGLFGSALLLDLSTGVSAGYSADAVDGFLINGNNINENFHQPPGGQTPSLSSVGGSVGAPTAYVFNNGALIQATYGALPSRPIDALSALFMQNNIFNEYVLGGGGDASTDWVLTFPTKKFYVDKLIVGATARAPFVKVFNGTSDVQVGLFPFDREEGNPGSCTGSDADNPNCGVCFSPCDDNSFSPPTLSFEAQVITFKSAADFDADPTSPVLGSQLTSNVDVRADFLSQGWMRIALNPTSEPHALVASSEGEVFSGLPTTGFAMTNYVNDNAAPNTLANYAGLWHHKGSRSCAAGTLACS
ncbi:MAG: hypothetical protein ABI866_09860 [Dokdonella sp.]